ncbi:sigma 54-interacting transcriptional regulator [Vibrio tritonius]|uniref:sigma 54-interacting transcriptional regulator n=1 Tax=Vibrio tritonius TaxID=1435069 RepID=UPI0008393B31|nr:sigma 54-interacting transcriptional regulator [Vibrio tritonius]
MLDYHEIAIFSVSRVISERISTLLIEKDIDILIYELEHYDAIDKARELINEGVKVIISRGGTANVLRRNLDIPVIEIPHDFFGIYKTVEEAKLRGKKLAAVGFPQYCNMLNHFQTMTNEQFQVCRVYNHKDIEHVMIKLKQDGYDVVIGGLSVSKYAKINNLEVVMGDTDNLSIEMAINQSINILKYIKDQFFRYDIVDSLCNNVRDSILAFNNKGVILELNSEAKRQFSCKKGDNILRLQVFKELYEYIISEQEVKSYYLSCQQKYFDVSITNVHVKETPFTILRAISITNKMIERESFRKSKFPAKYTFSDIIGESAEVLACIEFAQRYATNDLPVYIEGPTGTGKELFAQSIHNASMRKNQPFIAVNCSAIPETLLESELFGYEEGVFTGAKKGGKLGIFDMVDGGTLFLDEVSEISSLVQLKLLRVLQEKNFSRVGGSSLISTNFRLITASNKSLKRLVEQNKFRIDFYYRLNILKLSIPSLQDRGHDILLLANNILAMNDIKLNFTDEAIDYMLQYQWPGNIRELQALIYRLMVLCDSNQISVRDIITNSEEANFSPSIDSDNDVEMSLEKSERELISQVLAKTNGDRTKASTILGMSSTTLWRRIKKYQLEC